MASLILQIQERITDRLSRVPELAGLPVIARKPKQTLNEIEAQLAGLSAGLFVWPPLLRQVRPNSTGLFAEEIEVRVSAFENAALNTGELDAYRLVELALFYLHHCDLKITGVSMLYAKESPVTEESTSELLVFDMTFACSGGFEARQAHV